MAAYVLSDLHLHDEPQRFLFTAEKERLLVTLAREVLAGDHRLVFAGDVFDLTGMNPPRALEQFFQEALPRRRHDPQRIAQAGRVRTLPEQLAALRQRFPDFFQAVGALAAEGKLVWIPGNHDLAVGSPEGREQLRDALGVSRPIPMPDEQELCEGVISAHGHQFDPSNSAEGEPGTTPGAVITAAIYRALMPALAMLGVDAEVVEAIPAVRPEEEIAVGLKQYLSRRQMRRLLVALTRLLERNGYFHGVQGRVMRLVVRDVPVLSALVRALITPRMIRAAMANDRQLKEEARAGAASLRGKLLPGPSGKRAGDGGRRLVVLGHTHVLDHGEDYVNLGTWIDHLTGLGPRELDAVDRTLPVLFATPDGQVSLHDARALPQAGTLARCPELWRFEATRSADRAGDDAR